MKLFAYLDPGTGSMVLQIIIGAIVGVGVVIKAYWAKIRGLFIKKSKKETTNEE